MDIEQVDHIHKALSADLMVACPEASGTSYDAFIVAMRLFSDFLAAYVAEADLPRTDLRGVIEAYGRAAAALARGRLRDIRGYDVLEVDDEDTGPV
jgi:hypothetical protein